MKLFSSHHKISEKELSIIIESRLETLRELQEREKEK